MISFIDVSGNRHNALTEITKRKAVNGEDSLAGTIHANDIVTLGIGRGWKLEFEGERYVITYARPADEVDGTITLEFDAVHEFFWDMSKSVVYDTLEGSNTMRAYLDFVFNGIDYDYVLDANVYAFEKENFGYDKRLNLFNDIISTTGVEFIVTGRVVRIMDKVGRDLTTTVRKGLNMQDFTIEKNINDFITYKRAFGAWFDDEDHSKGRLEVEYESPLSQIYGRLEGEPVVDERFSVEENLLERITNEVENSYSVSVQLTMEDLTNAGYDYERPQQGDYIMAINEDLEFFKRVRIISFESEYDTAGELIDHYVTCDSIGVVRSNENKEYDQIRNEIDRIDRNINTVQIAANGKNRIFRGPDEPTTGLLEGDLWYRPAGNGEVDMLQWTGAFWDLLVSTGVNNEIDNRLKEAKQAAENARQRADNAYNRVQQAIDDAKEAYDYADSAIRAANGKNTVYRGNEKPSDGTPNDIWFEYLIEDGEPVTRMHIHDANDWQLRANDASMLGGTLDLAELNVINLNMDSATGGSLHLDRGIKVENNGKDILRVENDNVTMDLDNLLIESNVGGKGLNDAVGTAIYQNNEDVGLIYEGEDGDTKALINIGKDGPYLAGENIVLDGDTIIDGSFTVTNDMIARGLTADKITAGTLNANNVRVINLDVDSISGFTSTFFRSRWNDAVGGGVTISGAGGVRTRAVSNEETRLEDGGIKLYDRGGGYTGKLDSSYSNEGAGGVGIFVRASKHFTVVRETGSIANPSYTPIFYLRANSNNLRMNANLSMLGHNVVDVQTYRFTGGNAAVRRQAENNVEITTHGEDNRAVLFGQTTAQFERNIDMNGRTITNQSDIRLKSNVKDSQLDALREIERLRFIDYEWDKSKGAINENKPEERQFGLIAQYTPFLQTKAGESESYLSVDLTKQINLNSKGLQELLNYTRSLEKRIGVLENEQTE